VVEFDRSHQRRALREGWLAWQRWRADRREPAPAASGAPRARERAAPDLRPLAPAALGVLGAAALAWAAWRRSRTRWRGARLPAFYADALRLLERHRGLARGPSVSAREFAREASRAIPPAAAAAFWSLTEAYLAARFGGRRPEPQRAALRTLRDTLRRR